MAKNRKTPDMNLPVWFDGQNINEALFCEEFLQERRIIFANGAFFTPDGRVTDDLPLRGEIYDKLKFCAVNNIPRKITNILEVLKLEAQVPDFPPEQDRIHLSNGTLLLNGTFTEGRPAIVRSRLPVAYNPDATAPVIWLNFLDGLLYAEDIPTLQEFTVDTPGNLIDIDADLLQLGGLRPDVAGVHVDDIPVNEHFPGIGGKVFRVELGHFLLDQGPFFRRHRDAQHNVSCSVCHSFTVLSEQGFGAFPNKQPATARRDRGGPVFGSVATLPMLATLLFLR